MSSFKNFLLLFLMPEKCYERLVVNFHFHVPCVVFVLRKIFSFWILLDALFAQLFQLILVLRRGSCEGLSLTSMMLQLYVVSCPVVFSISSNFPFVVWSERMFVVCQTLMIIFLILHFQGQTFTGLLLLLVSGASMYLLVFCINSSHLLLLNRSSSAALVLSKAFQVFSNHRSKHTRHLSTTSVLLTWMSSLGTSFISMQDSGCSLDTLIFSLSSCLSCFLLAQLFTSNKQKED